MDFNKAIDRVLLSEGGYSDDQNDPGNWTGGKIGVGELRGTKYGIAANTYPELDIKNLSIDDCKALYKRDFWDVIEGDNLPDAIAYAAIDFAINSGCQTAIRYLQKALGVADDGRVGPVTIDALKNQPISSIAMTYLALRLEFMTKLKNWPHAGKGWARRIADNMLYAAEDLLK